MNTTKWLIWLPPVALFAIAIMFVQCWRLSVHPAVCGLVAILIYALISYFMDVAWRLTVKNYPIYKRHLAIFGLLLLFIVTQEWYLLLTLNLKSSNWLMGVIGVMIGLGFSSLPFILGSRNPAYGWMLGSNKRNDPSRRLVIVADFHWEEEEGLSGLQQVTLAMPDADWLFLGDIFNIWIGIKGYETLAQRNFIWWVSERRRTGHWVGLWLGNREYFLDDLADKFDFIGEGVNGTLEGEPFAFEHGDLINPNDRHYRFWNLVSRSGFTWLLGKIIPSFIRRRLVLYLVEKLQTTNEAYKTEFPKDEFQNAAYESGAPFLITGHFHTLEKFEKGMSIPWAREGKLLIWQNDEFNVVDSKFQ